MIPRVLFFSSVVKKIPTGMILLPQQNPTEQKEPPPRQKTNSSPKLLLLLLRARACARVCVCARVARVFFRLQSFRAPRIKSKRYFPRRILSSRAFSVVFCPHEMFLMRILFFFFLLENDDEIAASRKIRRFALLCFAVLSFAL